MKSPQHFALIVAGGVGQRMNMGLPKQFIELKGRPILMYTIEKFHAVIPQGNIYITLPEEHMKSWENICKDHSFDLPHTVVNGGETRFHSVKNGLSYIDSSKGNLVAIHDGVRPIVTVETIRRGFSLAEKHGNAIAAVPLKDSIREIDEDEKTHHRPRQQYRIIQTPQCFAVKLIKQAFRQEYSTNFTDDASVAEAAGENIHLYTGDYENIKITTPEDLKIAEAFLS